MVAGPVADVGGDDQHEARLVRVGRLARGVGQPDLTAARIRHDSGGIVAAELADSGGAAQTIPGPAFSGVYAIRRLELGLHGTLELLGSPQAQRLVEHGAAVQFRVGRHMGVDGGEQVRVERGGDLGPAPAETARGHTSR